MSNGELSGTFSAVQTIGFLASLNGCESQAQNIDLSAENARSQVYEKSYSCNGLVTQLYTIAGLGHYGWAGSLPLTIDDETVTLNDAIFKFITTVRG